MDTKIIVAAHKPYPIPSESIYLPVQVGAFQRDSIGFQRDDENDNISWKNPCYSELTGLYWAWKNLRSDYLGLVHYRRYFKGRHGGKGLGSVLSRHETESLLKKYDVILPRKQYYLIETIYSHYQHTHYEEDLQKTREVLETWYPEYIDSFDRALKRRSSHMFNMFIMKRSLADSYCSFLFDVLEKLEEKLNTESYDPFQARVYGRIGEILLDVWIEKNHVRYTEVPVVYTEKINWLKKGTAFLSAKFFNRKYNSSF